ncbi:hypothetical protein [Sporosarcina sp. ITBMC105]
MSKLKKYKIRYEKRLDWSYVVKNADDPWDLVNMNESTLVFRNCGVFEEIVEAANKNEAKAMLAVLVAHQNIGVGVPVLPIIRDAYRGIIEVSEVPSDE